MPRNTLTVWSIRLAVMMSGMPSPLTSVIATEAVPSPAASGAKGRLVWMNAVLSW